jgi:hypothetical protein
MEAPSGLPAASGGMIAIDLSADSDYPAWKKPIRTYFRRDGGAWKLVGLERMPEQAAGNGAPRKTQ